MTVLPEWDAYWLGVAEAVSKRGDCVRRQVGAVVVRGQQLLSAGCNDQLYVPGEDSARYSCGQRLECPRGRTGVPHGTPTHEPCYMIHAERKALRLLPQGSIFNPGLVMYVSCKPCDNCWKLCVTNNMKRVVWPDGESEL